MPELRPNPYMFATWISRPLVGEKNCQWAPWFKANFQDYARVPSTFDSAKWNMEHTELLYEFAERLEARGCQLFIERQNEFRAESPHSGMIIHGRPDIIAVGPDGRATIYDVKTGRESDSHMVQVQLYMYLVPRAQNSRWCDTTFDGGLVYANGEEKLIPASSVDEAFLTRVGAFMRKMMSDTPARRVPSAPECGWCDISRRDCPERVEN